MPIFDLSKQSDRNKYAYGYFPRQYGYMSSANRAINNYEKKHGKQKGKQFVVNQLDENCFEVELCIVPKI
jgi:hypothetical protein